MRKAFLLCCAAAVLTLAGCSDNAVSDTASSLPAEETTSGTVSSPAFDTSSEAEKRISVKAEVKSYRDEILCFEYEGREYSLPFDRDEFDNDWFIKDRDVQNLSERIINNKLGETVYAKLALNKDMTKIFLCDVINTNGIIDTGMTPVSKDYTVSQEILYTMKRKGETLCEFYNSAETVECDLNDLPMIEKLDYPETLFPVEFTVYKFRDGKNILLELVFSLEVTDTSVGSCTTMETYDTFGKRTGFYGTVKNVSDNGTVTVLLNDGKTYCTVPTYFNDGGELKEGSEIFVMLKADSSLFGRGGEHVYDYAVISMKRDFFIPTLVKFNELAYAVFSGWNRLSFTMIKDIG